MEEQDWIRGPIIGRGSTATVSLAITNSGDFFAVKSSEFSSSALLQREQSILSSLSSPYIVKYVGSNVTMENDKLMYNLLMEYVSGGSIYDLIKNSGGKLPEPVIRSFTRQILKGLVYLHDQGIVHCDLKSQNVMIGGELAKIVDLGCAKTTVEEDENLEFSGTPAFMSPEVARGEEQSFPADVWALGCLVIEMATGSSPWPELNDVVAAIYKIGFTGESPEIPVWLSDKGKDFLKNCLRKDQKQRWTVEELLQHPFLDNDNDDDKARNCLYSSSPSTVLDQGFWDLCETSRSRLIKADHEDPFANSTNLVTADRIKKLAGDKNCGEPDWETNGWIEVRGEIEKRNEDEDENCVEATSLEEEEEEEEVGGFENWIWDQEDSLFLEYSPENNINYFYSYNNFFFEEDIIIYYDHLEVGFVPKVDNKKTHFFSHVTSSCFEIPYYNRFQASYTGKYSDDYSKEQQVI